MLSPNSNWLVTNNESSLEHRIHKCIVVSICYMMYLDVSIIVKRCLLKNYDNNGMSCHQLGKECKRGRPSMSPIVAPVLGVLYIR